MKKIITSLGILGARNDSNEVLKSTEMLFKTCVETDNKGFLRFQTLALWTPLGQRRVPTDALKTILCDY